MSCINNSTISGIFVTDTVTTVTSGKRLSFKQNTSVAWDSNIVAGDVIRYDVDNAKFTRSIADPAYDSNGLSNAEVVGIVESIAQSSGVTYATVVTNGLINYPNLLDTIAGISASAGGIGGTDIYFLSATTPGGISFGVAEGSGYIAKPVLQVCPTSDGSFNSVVINYLGYETSQPADFTVGTSESVVGDIKMVQTPILTVPSGWIEADGQLIDRDTYPEAFRKWGYGHGNFERLVVNGYSVSGLLGKQIAPIWTNGQVYGNFAEIIEVDTNTNSVVVEHTANGGPYGYWEFLQSSQYQIQGSTTKLTVTSGRVTKFRIPKLTSTVTLYTNTTAGSYELRYAILVRIAPDSRVSYLPDVATFNSVDVTDTLSTPNVTDVDAKLVSLESRIQALEQRLLIS